MNFIEIFHSIEMVTNCLLNLESIMDFDLQNIVALTSRFEEL